MSSLVGLVLAFTIPPFFKNINCITKNWRLNLQFFAKQTSIHTLTTCSLSFELVDLYNLGFLFSIQKKLYRFLVEEEIFFTWALFLCMVRFCRLASFAIHCNLMSPAK